MNPVPGRYTGPPSLTACWRRFSWPRSSRSHPAASWCATSRVLPSVAGSSPSPRCSCSAPGSECSSS